KEDAIRVTKQFISYGYKATHRNTLPAAVCSQSYWTTANKHKSVTDRDIEFLRAYVAIAMAAGAPLHVQGIRLADKEFVHCDRAVMNSCLNAGLVELDGSSTIFQLTFDGLQSLGLA